MVDLMLPDIDDFSKEDFEREFKFNMIEAYGDKSSPSIRATRTPFVMEDDDGAT